LIDRGYSWKEIWWDLTIDQVYLFLRSAVANLKEDRMQWAIHTRYAVNADRSEWMRFVSRGRAQERKKVIDKYQAKALQRMMNGKRK
jgi:hypothetical protein